MGHLVAFRLQLLLALGEFGQRIRQDLQEITGQGFTREHVFQGPPQLARGICEIVIALSCLQDLLDYRTLGIGEMPACVAGFAAQAFAFAFEACVLDVQALLTLHKGGDRLLQLLLERFFGDDLERDREVGADISQQVVMAGYR